MALDFYVYEVGEVGNLPIGQSLGELPRKGDRIDIFKDRSTRTYEVVDVVHMLTKIDEFDDNRNLDYGTPMVYIKLIKE